MTSSSFDCLVKLLLIGDSGVGKSALLARFVDDSFTPSFITTIGIDFKLKTVSMRDKRVKLQIWDTAGQERFRTITQAYYRGAMGVLFVFDVTDETSFENVTFWINNVEKNATPNVKRVLVGTKCDLGNERVVETSRAQRFSDSHDMKFFEASSVSGVGVAEVFTDLTEQVVDGMPHERKGKECESFQNWRKTDNPNSCCK